MKYIKVNSFKCTCPQKQNHVHELHGSLYMDSSKEVPHNHRFLTITNESIPISETNHVHEVTFRTDFTNGHYHEFFGRTSAAITVGDGHIHYMESITTDTDGHCHKFKSTTCLDNPTGI